MLTLLSKAAEGKQVWEIWYFWIGLIAAVCIAIFSMPQLIKTIKTKHTEGLSIMMLSLLVFGDFCFALNGIGMLIDNNLAGGLPLLLANIVACSTSAVLLMIKFNAMRWAKKFGVSEKAYCDNYDSYKTKKKMLRAEKHAQKNKPSNLG